MLNRPQPESLNDASVGNSDEIPHENVLQDGLVPMDTASDSSGDDPEQIDVIESHDSPQSVERLYGMYYIQFSLSDGVVFLLMCNQ